MKFNVHYALCITHYALLAALLFPVAVSAKRPSKKAQMVSVAPTPAVVSDTLDLTDSEGDEPGSLDDIEVENVGIPEWLQTHISGDTLYVACAQDMLPRRLVVMTNDGECLYKLLPAMMGELVQMEHPADSVYKHIWTATRVNPYATPIDSLQDSIQIDMRGFCMPVAYTSVPDGQHPLRGYVTSRFGFRR